MLIRKENLGREVEKNLKETDLTDFRQLNNGKDESVKQQEKNHHNKISKILSFTISSLPKNEDVKEIERLRTFYEDTIPKKEREEEFMRILEEAKNENENFLGNLEEFNNNWIGVHKEEYALDFTKRVDISSKRIVRIINDRKDLGFTNLEIATKKDLIPHSPHSLEHGKMFIASVKAKSYVKVKNMLRTEKLLIY